jgi:hypothetical protein
MPKVTYFEGVLWSKFFSKIGQRRGKGRVWGQFDLATVGSLQENFTEKVTTGHTMWTMGWPINHINKRLNLGMQDVPWGNEWWVPGGYASVNYLMENGGAQNQAPGNDKPLPPPKEEPKKMIECSFSNEETHVENCKSFVVYRLPIEKEYKSKLKTLLFAQRKAALVSVYENKEICHNGKGYDKLEKELQEVYFTAIYKGRFSIWNEADSSFDDTRDMYDEKIMRFIEAKASFVVSNFKGLIDNLTEAFVLFKSKNSNDNEVFAEKIREIYNYLTQKSSLLAETEVEAAFSFGRSLEADMIEKELKDSLIVSAKL